MPYKHPFLSFYQIRMNFKKIEVIRGIRNYDYPLQSPAVTIICPACSSEVETKEIVEKKGRIGCINCLR